MATKTYSGADGVEAGRPTTKIRAEQVKSEDGFNSLAVDLEALRGQVKDIIGAADYKEWITGEYAKVQIVDLADHLDASQGAAALSVKKNIAVAGSGSIAADFDVNGQATFASANVEDLTSGRIVVAGASGELKDFSGLTFDGTDLVAGSAKVSDLTATRVVYVGTDGALVDSSEMTFNTATGLLTLAKDLSARSGSFGGDLTVTGDLFVNGAMTYVNTANLQVTDKKVVIANGASGASLDGAGIYLGSDASVDESIRWATADGGKWIASDKFAADTLQALDLSESIVWADASGNLVEITNAQLGEAVDNLFVASTGMHISRDALTGEITFAIGQAVETHSEVTFAAVTGSNLTANRLMASNGSKTMVSVADLTAWVAGTANQVTVTDDLDGSITLSLPQDIHSGASPQFSKVFLDGNGASDAFIDTDGSDMLVLGYRDAAGTGVVSLPVAQSGSYTLSGFTATSIVGALNELKTAALASSKKAAYTNTGASEISAGTDIAGSVSWPGAAPSPGFLPELTGQNSLVFVNGMLMQGGGVDYTLSPGAGTLSFAFALQVGDVVVIQKA
jgi:hypothetical protein